MADKYCIIPLFLAYKEFKGSYSDRIRFNQAEESKYEILIPFEKLKSSRSHQTQRVKYEWTCVLYDELNQSWNLHVSVG